MAEKTIGKSSRFRTSGALFGPRPPDPDLGRIHTDFSKVERLKIPLGKVVDFEPLGALFGLGGLEADLTPI